MRVLHAEDDDSKATTIERFLCRFHEVEYVRVRDGFAAERVLHAPTTVDRVITDWEMPGGGQRVVERCVRLGIPIIVVSGGMVFPAFRARFPGVPWICGAKGLGIALERLMEDS